MIIYEVNLEINPVIYVEYCQWLKTHIAALLQLPGFIAANCYEQVELSATVQQSYQHLIIHYQVDTLENLINYFEQYAHAMRQEGVKKFNGQFHIKRRILKPTSIISPEYQA